MKVTYSCCCCLVGTSDKALRTPHTRLGVTEIYSDMLEECFQIHLTVNNEEYGICELCVGRLRDASDFKQQVQRSQAELRARLYGALQVKDEDPLLLPDKAGDGASGESLLQAMIFKCDDEAAVKLEMVEEDGTADKMLRAESPVKAEPPVASDEDFVSLASPGAGRAVALLPRSSGLERLRGDATHACQICHKTFEQESCLTRHFKDMNAESIGVRTEEKAYKQEDTATAYSCEICSKSFSRKNLLSKHARTHNGEETYTCELYNKINKHCTEKSGLIDDQIRTGCNKQSILRGDLKRHIETRTTRKVFNCEICNKSFARKCNMLRHVGIHTGLKPYSCDICNMQFTRSENLKKHGRIHTGIIDTDRKNYRRKLYKCDTCNKLFTQKISLQLHVRIHTGEKPYNCDICNKSFTQKCYLRLHARIHTGQKPYSCHICNKKFAVMANLRSHVGVHTGLKPYCCHICSRLFRRQDNLNRHIKIHTGQKCYSCHICNKQFIQKSNLRYHIVHAGHILA